MPTNAELHERRQAAIARGIGASFPVYAQRADNAELWDVEGRRYVDFTGGIAVLNTGHLHPQVVAAVSAQLERFSHTCFMVAGYEPAIALAERLNALAPGPSPKKTAFFNSGAEAVENAVKIARSYTGRPGVIAFSGGFHGRTLMALALTGKVSPYKAGFGPFPAEVFHAPYPHPYRGVTGEDSLEAIEHIFKDDIEPGRVAAIVVEPVLGEGGYVPAPPEFLVALRELCDRHGIVMVADEVQTGFARTGRWFAVEHASVEPDLVCMAKSLAGGFPLSAVTGKVEIMDAPGPGGLGGTYGASPLSCAAALAVIDVIETEGLAERAQAIGSQVVKTAEGWAETDPRIGEVRGLGAMVGIEMVADPDTRAPDPERTKAITNAALEEGLLLLSCGVNSNVLRVMVPLTASDDLVSEGLEMMGRAMAAV
ncbi:MAG TPA: 4-aminobutyrate--2-oxoglutarate transaminase [Acidimicrobiia bacterium]|nr:4-aminobutyrate--2-oxoglutarate transaminase [Acidimicrobiia bacterium]